MWFAVLLNGKTNFLLHFKMQIKVPNIKSERDLAKFDILNMYIGAW